MSGQCPCVGRLSAAEHDLKRFAQDRDDYRAESLIQAALAAKAEEKRGNALVRLAALQRHQDCQLCMGTGIIHGNGSAAVRGSQGRHAEEQPSYRAVKIG